MDTMRTVKLLLALSTALFISSCASGPGSRISKNPQIFSKLNAKDQQAVQAGQIREGMDKQAVFLAWGRPNSVSEGKRGGQNLERWTYNTLRPVFISNYGMGFWGGGRFGGRCGGWGGPMMGTMVDYVPTPGPSVEFTNDKVSGYTVPTTN
jgi:outer membrane lipoprotein SlyB